MNLVTDEGDLLITEDDEEILVSYNPAPLYQWHCREFGDQTARIRCSLAPADDLDKGDGVTASTFPAFVYTDTDTCEPSHYVFDGSDDYVSNWPTMPDAYTVCAVVDTGIGPDLWTCNDGTIQAFLVTGGLWSGKLYRIAIFDEVLDAEQIAYLEYRWVSKVPRVGCRGIEHRLIIDESCVLNHRYIDGDAVDRSLSENDGAETLVSYGSDGATFDQDTSLITVTYDASLQLSALSIVFTASVPAEKIRSIVYRGTNYRVAIKELSIEFHASGVSRELVIPNRDAELHHYCVSCESGIGFKLYLDGEFVEQRTAVSTLGTSTANLTIGQMYVSGDPCTIGTVQIYNRALNAHEIKALYNRSKIG